MPHFIQNGSTYKVVANTGHINDELLPGNYVVKVSPITGFYLERSEDFSLPDKIYGNTEKHAERILQTYRDRGKNTGVLLVGEKGSGKTLLLRYISIVSNLPVLFINEPHTGDAFFEFLTSITQPCIVALDEFEKTYGGEDTPQESVLTLLDGTYQSNKLFIFTSNDKWELDTNLINRPGRIYYFLEYKGVDKEFIAQYCEDNLKNKEYIQEICAFVDSFFEFNFDMLVALVEEMNRYGENVETAAAMLNIKNEYAEACPYAISMNLGDELKLTPRQLELETHMATPYVTDVCVPIKFLVDMNALTEEETDFLREIDENQVNFESFDFPFLRELIKNGKVHFSRKTLSAASTEETRTEYFYLYVTLQPEDISKTEGRNIIYNINEDFSVTLYKKKK